MCPQGGWVNVLDLSNSVIFYHQTTRHQLPWNFLLSQPMHNALTVPEQTTPASSACPQSCRPQPREGHLHTWDSFPPQFSSSSQMGPDPWPNWANFKASRAPPQPSCLHTTRASSRSQPSSQMVPQEPWSRISTLPVQEPLPSTRRSCLLPEEREMWQWGVDAGVEEWDVEEWDGAVGMRRVFGSCVSSEASEPAGWDMEFLHLGKLLGLVSYSSNESNKVENRPK